MVGIDNREIDLELPPALQTILDKAYRVGSFRYWLDSESAPPPEPEENVKETPRRKFLGLF
jgi:hypothetical protein